MRAPLRAVTNEVTAAGPHAAKPTEVDEYTMHEWRRRWRLHMSEAVVYFDDIPRDIVQSYRPYLRVLGSLVQPFFDANVTHVISNRQSGPVVAKARDKGTRIYSNDKLARFLSSLVGYTPPPAAAAPAAKLDELLEHEKRQDTVNAAYARKEANFHSFRGPYLLVYDRQQVNRPLAIKEWRPAAVPEDGSWPQLRATPLGVCPFVARSRPPKRRRDEHRDERHPERKQQDAPAEKEQPADVPDTEHRLQALPQQQRPQQQAPSPQALPPQQDGSRAKRRALSGPSAPGLAGLGLLEIPAPQQPTNPLVAGPPTPQDAPQALFPLAARNENADKENRVPGGAPQAGPTASQQQSTQQSTQQFTQPTQASTRLREFGEIAASGVQRYSQTSTKSFATHVGPSREVANLKRKVLPPAAAPARPPQAQAPPPPGGAPGGAAAGAAGAARPTRRPGYCENCLERYEDLAEHLKSQTHVMFATNEKKFRPLHEALSRFKRYRGHAQMYS